MLATSRNCFDLDPHVGPDVAESKHVIATEVAGEKEGWRLRPGVCAGGGRAIGVTKARNHAVRCPTISRDFTLS